MRSFIGSPVENSNDFSNILKSLGLINGINPVSPNNLHLTYIFLSEINDIEKNIVIDSLKQLKFKSLACRILSIKTLPEGPNPRVIVITLDCPELYNINHELGENLYLKSNRTQRFLPHITIGRYRKHFNPVPLESLKLDISVVRFSRICLYKSTLTPVGSIYEKLYCKESL